MNAQVNRDEGAHLHEGAEQIYRCVAQLRDALPIETQRCVAVVFEWALEGINRENQLNRAPDIEALCAAISYARDALVETVNRDRK